MVEQKSMSNTGLDRGCDLTSLLSGSVSTLISGCGSPQVANIVDDVSYVMRFSQHLTFVSFYYSRQEDCDVGVSKS